ncbi:efflux RND transporter periplasmic adaptor subunit [Lacinutrix jangbogonensis]|uniref:efflux RND transporter periplasmic adaptor subunit n=1 Tax=Lacinutrix jangbogonensis TaxID=1469557 RepID=UPI00053E7CEC|nr:efflux RND transporter periplasmic adaptor subunit [Lacinutrix jangbogonensis]
MKNTTVTFGLLLITVFFMSCAEEKKQQKAPLRPVSYQEVGFLGGNSSRTFSGTANTDKVINLSFRNNGIITEFNLKIGQIVKKGQLLAKLDNVQSRLNYENSLSSLNSAKSQMNTAKLSLNRVRSLYEKGSTSLSDYEDAKNQYRTAVDTFESAKRSVSIQQEQINYGYIYASENGVIAAVNAEIDENVRSGQNIAVLHAGKDMEIALGIPENTINQVNKNMPVVIHMSSLKDKAFDGVITEVSPSIDQNTSTYPVRVKITNPSQNIKSGMAANVTFEFGKKQTDNKTLVVPAKSVGEDANGNFVFLIEISGDKTIAKKQPIKVGKLTSEGFAVIEGVSAGQKIAIAGLQTLLDGQEVKLQ